MVTPIAHMKFLLRKCTFLRQGESRMTFFVKEDCTQRIEEKRIAVKHFRRKETMDIS